VRDQAVAVLVEVRALAELDEQQVEVGAVGEHDVAQEPVVHVPALLAPGEHEPHARRAVFCEAGEELLRPARALLPEHRLGLAGRGRGTAEQALLGVDREQPQLFEAAGARDVQRVAVDHALDGEELGRLLVDGRRGRGCLGGRGRGRREGQEREEGKGEHG